MMKCYSVFHIEQKAESGKFNCIFVNFLRYSFKRIKVISIVVERERTPDNATDLLCISIDWFVYDKKIY